MKSKVIGTLAASALAGLVLSANVSANEHEAADKGFCSSTGTCGEHKVDKAEKDCTAPAKWIAGKGKKEEKKK